MILWIHLHVHAVVPLRINYLCPLMFVCFFVWGNMSQSRNFYSFGDFTIIWFSEGLQILTYTRHSCPLRNEGSLACYTYCDTDQSFIMVISEDKWHTHLWGWRYPDWMYLKRYFLGIFPPNLSHSLLRNILSLSLSFSLSFFFGVCVCVCVCAPPPELIRAFQYTYSSK